MLKIRYWIKDFFGFPRSQVNGFIILLILVAVLIFSEPAWHWWMSNRTPDITADRAKLDSLVALWDAQKVQDTPPEADRALFHINPNNSTEDQFIALGFSQQQAARMIRYREKGGKFRTKSDILKIYGVDTAFYERIYSFIILPEVEQPTQKALKKYPAKDVVSVKERREKIDLNKADTSALKEIYGIGEKLSLRILKYREVLGGFISMDQLNEVYGLDSLVIKRLLENALIRDEFEPIKIDINGASERQLSAHPYLKKIASAIVAYRFQHGDFKSVDDIRKVVNLDEKNFQKIAPYLDVKSGL